MAFSKWGENADSIDLTMDSDEDTPDTIAPPLKKTPVPLPENVRHRFGSDASLGSQRTPVALPEKSRHAHKSSATNSTSNRSATPKTKPLAKVGRSGDKGGSSDASAGAGGDVRSGARGFPDVSSLYAKAQEKIDYGSRLLMQQPASKTLNALYSRPQEQSGYGLSMSMQQPEKRRKTTQETFKSSVSSQRKTLSSSNTNSTSGHLGNRSGRTTDDDGLGMHRAGQPKRVEPSSTRDKMMSRQSLNDALKSTPSVRGVSSALLASEARTLHIGREPEEGTHQLLPAKLKTAILARVKPSVPRSPTPPETNISEPGLGASNLDEQDDGLQWGIDDDVQTHKPRTSPFKDPSRIPEEQNNRHSPLPTLRESLNNSSGNEAERNPLLYPPGHVIRVGMTTEDLHLLIFLKEVKMFTWNEIVSHFQHRNRALLQNNYSKVFNKRDRSLDPPTLILPAQYASEATIDWPTVHSNVDIYQRGYYNSLKTRQAAEPKTIRQPKDTAVHSTRQGDQLEHDIWSEYDSAPRQNTGRRPRRSTAQEIDYTLRRRRRTAADIDALDDDDLIVTGAREFSVSYRPRSLEPSEEPSNSGTTNDPLNEPMDIDFELEDANIVVSSQNKPYLSHAARSCVRNGLDNSDWDQIGSRKWQGSVVHVDFSNDEMEIIERIIGKVLGPSTLLSGSQRKRLRLLLQGQAEPKLIHLSYEIQRNLRTRDRASIDAFLQDAINGKVSSRKHIERLGAARLTRDFSSRCNESTSTLIRQRELGTQARRGWKSASTPLSHQMKNKVYDTIGPAYSYTGASSDITTVAWSPDGEHFAAGAVCVTDSDSMQYNRPNNLLYGSIPNKTVYELAEHRTKRTRPERGPNSTYEMHISQDRFLYHTVSAVAFSKDYMFSAGYDENVIVWRIKDRSGSSLSEPTFVKALKHRAKVDLLAVNCGDVLQLATAAKREQRAIKVCTIHNDDDYYTDTYESRKGNERPDQKILPTSLKFEPTWGRMLLAGFGANKSEDRFDTTGDICLWDIETKQQLEVSASTSNVFDVAWQPNQFAFAVGCVATQKVNRGTRSVVRLYDGRGFEKRRKILEAECPALDMNDVVFSPFDGHIVAAGCTSGSIYIWDLRRPDDHLFKLSHGMSLQPLDERQDHEVTDTGVRFLSWGENATRLYTGSSDGVVKVWDITRSTEDVFIKDLVTCDSGVMSGAFSPDKSRLIIGEVNGSVSVLEVGRDDFSVKDMEKLRYKPYKKLYDDNDEDDDAEPVISPINDSGRATASTLISSGQMQIVPFGGFPMRQAVQGPNYLDTGLLDYSVDAPYLREQALELQLSLAKVPGPQCDLPSCKDNIKVTSEMAGDSGRSEDRIPYDLLQQWTLTDSPNVITGKSKCTKCGRPARPADSTNVTQTQLCERCQFSCFRCGGICKMKPSTEKLICQTCYRVWEAGALGYKCVEDTGCRILPADTPSLSGSNLSVAAKFMDENASYGDEENALTDYYLSLAMDRPESPPL